MDNRLEKIRAILAEQDNQQNRPNDGSFDAIYPFWNMKTGNSSTVRFLPDGNTKNPLPWVESQMIQLQFPGIIGQPIDKMVRLKVPCVEMWGLACPILGHVRKEKWFDDKDTEELGRKYWKKYSYIMQGFVVEDGIGESKPPENPIRRFVFGKQIFNLIRSGYADPDLEYSVDDYDEGIDFVIQAESSGSFNNYTQSRFKRKSRALTQDERDAVETHGLNRLEDFLPKKPSDEELQLIFEMFIASVEGEFYNPEKWGHLPWRPRNIDTSSNVETPKAETRKVEPKVEKQSEETDETEKVEPTEDDAKRRTQEILAKIRSNQK